VIYLWLKIIYYKITKALSGSWSTWCRIHAEAGTDTTVPRVRVGHDPAQPVRHEAETQPEVLGVALDPATRDGLVLYSRQAGERMRELIEKGLVHEPDGLGDLQRLEQLYEDRLAREQRASHDPSACPCGGRHFPSADSCRWCRCHDPRNEHHTEGARGIMQVIKSLTEDQERLAADARRAFEQLYPGPLFFDHPYLMDVPAEPDQLMAVRPPKEIVCCPRCDHPQHGENGGRCAFLVAGQDSEGPLTVCRCVVTESEA